MRVATINPPFLRGFSRGQRSPAVTRSGTLYYPIWLAYATGSLEDAGHEVDLIDAPAGDLDQGEVLRRVAAFDPGLVVVESSTPSIESDAAFADSLADRPCILVGTHPSALPAETLSLGRRFHAVAVGEYDLTCVEAAAALSRGGSLDSVPGLWVRSPVGPLPTGPARVVADLDSLPQVSRVYARHLDPRRYSNPNALHPMVMIMGGRGCPGACTFCLFPQTLTGRAARFRSIGSIVAEVRWVEENMPGVRSVFFEDDTLSADTGRLRSLASAMSGAGCRIRWTANMRASVDLRTLRECRRAGLRTVCVGFESGDPEMLRAMGKGIDPAASAAFARDAAEAGVLVHGCFLFGTPGETRETMRRTLEFALGLPLYSAQFYPMMVYPGTEAYRRALSEGMLTATGWRDWLTEGGRHRSVVRTAALTAREISDFCDHARRRFYLRPGYVARTALRAFSDRDELRRTLKAFGHFWRPLLRGGGR
jgi:radical SAM superfamily enzyme YgiQ (UPF0313 family)